MHLKRRRDLAEGMDESNVDAVVLSPLEARVLGCLMEKEATTPDIYPLSLNSLVNACNQKSNRSPVMDVGESEVSAAVELLRDKHLVTVFAGAGARAVKFRHKFGEVFPMEPAAQALMAELMLRGPQTAAGLRGNCERLAAMPGTAEVEEMLNDLAARAVPWTVKLARQAGQKEARWATLLMDTGELSAVGDQPAAKEDGGRAAVAFAMKLPAEAEARIAALEADVAGLKAELVALRESLGG